MGSKSTRRSAPRVFDGRRLGVVVAVSGVLSMAGFAVLVSPASAKPEYLQAFNSKYGTSGTKLDSCTTCHTTQQDADHLNPYGQDFGKANHDFGAIEGLDSDADSFKNIDEINAGTFPGDPNDNPNTKAQPKPAPTTSTTAKSGPLSVLPGGLKLDPGQLLSILDGR